MTHTNIGYSVADVAAATKIICARSGVGSLGIWELVDQAFEAWKDDEYTRRDAYRDPEWAGGFVAFYLDSFIAFDKDGNSLGHAK